MRRTTTIPKSQTTRSFAAMYLSTLGILCCLLLAAQVVIQFALMQALTTQNAYSVLNAQQLRTQRLIRNAILLLDAHADRPTLAATLYSDEQAWEVTQDGIEHGNAGLHIAPGDFSGSVHNRLTNVRADYLKMRNALRDLIETVTAGTATNTVVGGYLAPIFYSGGVYSTALTAAASDVFIESNVYVANIRFIEFGLFVLCILTLIAEYVFVFRPAFRQMKAYLTTLHAVITEQEERMSHEQHVPAMPVAYSQFPEERLSEEEEESETGTIEEIQKGLFDDKKHGQ